MTFIKDDEDQYFELIDALKSKLADSDSINNQVSH